MSNHLDGAKIRQEAEKIILDSSLWFQGSITLPAVTAEDREVAEEVKRILKNASARVIVMGVLASGIDGGIRPENEAEHITCTPDSVVEIARKNFKARE